MSSPDPEPASAVKRLCWGLLQPRSCWLPTLRGWLVLLCAAGALLLFGVKATYPFLAVNDPLFRGALVVEGWEADHALKAAITEFRTHRYEKLYVTGGPLDRGAPLSEYGTYAELGAATLRRLGLGQQEVQAVPAPLVRQDRTYTSALALAAWLQAHGSSPTNFHLISTDAHSRRSRLMFQKALGPQVKIGVTAVESLDYDPKRWWQSSQGFRTVTGELIAYAYARLLFNPQGQRAAVAPQP